MRHAFRPVLFALVVGCLAAAATPASAQITITAQNTATSGYKLKYKVAFDSVNQVYLVVTAGAPVYGRFVDADGVPIGSVFTVSMEGGNSGWPCVTFGGPASDPVFLVTYLNGDGTVNPKVGRFVRYQGADIAPQVSNSFSIVNVYGDWPDNELSHTIWDGQQFIVSSRISHGGFPDTQLHHVDLTGTVTGGTFIGNDSFDASSHSDLACNGTGICMAFGTGWGANVGGTGASWGRVFDSNTLASISGYLQTDKGQGLLDAQRVTFNAKMGQFHTVQVRNRRSADFVTVQTDGTFAPPDYSKSLGPDNAQGVGMTALIYNAATKTSLLATKFGAAAELWVLELGDDGYPVNLANMLRITAWDGKTPDYYDETAADALNGRWLNVTSLNAGAFVTLVQGVPIGLGLSVLAVSPSTGTPGVTVKISGTGFQSGAAVTFGSSAPQVATFTSSSRLQVSAPALGPGTVNVSVTNPGGGMATKTDAFTYVNPTPTIGTLTPGTSPVGGPETTMIVSGTNFVTGATVYVNGVAHATSMVDCTHLSVVMPVSDFVVPATLSITVRNPDPASGNSPAVVFLVGSGGASLTFTDDPLVPGSTPVKAIHIAELRTAITTLRSRYGLSGCTWTDPVIVASGTSVKAVHQSELRAALNAVYAAASRPLPTYTHPTIGGGSTTITALDIAELRAAVLAIW